jgi:hypothetical protein
MGHLRYSSMSILAKGNQIVLAFPGKFSAIDDCRWRSTFQTYIFGQINQALPYLKAEDQQSKNHSRSTVILSLKVVIEGFC